MLGQTVAADLVQGATLDHIDPDDHHGVTHAIVIDTVAIERGVYHRVLVEGMVALVLGVEHILLILMSMEEVAVEADRIIKSVMASKLVVFGL